MKYTEASKHLFHAGNESGESVTVSRLYHAHWVVVMFDADSVTPTEKQYLTNKKDALAFGLAWLGLDYSEPARAARALDIIWKD